MQGAAWGLSAWCGGVVLPGGRVALGDGQEAAHALGKMHVERGRSEVYTVVWLVGLTNLEMP